VRRFRAAEFGFRYLTATAWLAGSRRACRRLSRRSPGPVGAGFRWPSKLAGDEIPDGVAW